MALIYEPGPIRGVQFTTLIVEDLYLIVNSRRELPVSADAESITLEEVSTLGLFLPEQIHTLRQVVQSGIENKGLKLKLVGEVESVPSLTRLLRTDLGATILPKSAADALFHEEDFRVLRIVEPALQCKIALCTPDHEPLSEAGSAVLLVLKEMLQEMLRSKYPPLPAK
jgi:LysR family nitrogen assimilation transcriptional regulator